MYSGNKLGSEGKPMLPLSAVVVHYQVLLCSDSYDTMLLLQTSYVSSTLGVFFSCTYL